MTLMTSRAYSSVIRAPVEQAGGRESEYSTGIVGPGRKFFGSIPPTPAVSTRGGRKACPATASREAPARGETLLVANGAGQHRSASRRFPDPRGRSSVGRASGCQPEGHGSESRRPLRQLLGQLQRADDMGWSDGRGRLVPTILQARVAQSGRAPRVGEKVAFRPEVDARLHHVSEVGGSNPFPRAPLHALDQGAASSASADEYATPTDGNGDKDRMETSIRSTSSRLGRTGSDRRATSGAGSPLERCHRLPSPPGCDRPVYGG